MWTTTVWPWWSIVLFSLQSVANILLKQKCVHGVTARLSAWTPARVRILILYILWFAVRDARSPDRLREFNLSVLFLPFLVCPHLPFISWAGTTLVLPCDVQKLSCSGKIVSLLCHNFFIFAASQIALSVGYSAFCTSTWLTDSNPCATVSKATHQ